MRVLAICDGGGSLGLGHVMRSIALAEAAADAGHDVVVAGHWQGSFLAGQLAAAPVEVVQLPAAMPDGGSDQVGHVLDLVGRLRPDVVHVDSYVASARLRELIFGLKNVLLSNVEDGTFGRRPADVVVDPTLGAERVPRPDDGSSWHLRGTRYLPLRRRVTDAVGARVTDAGEGGVTDAGQGGVPVREVARSVLVVMGGTDPVGLAPAAIALLAGTGLALDVTAVAVGENAERVRAAATGSALSVTVLAPVDDLPALMSEQDLVITAAGTSVWELCCIGVPMAVLWAVDNQRAGYEHVVAAGAALGLGGPELGRPELGRPELADFARGCDRQGGNEPVALLRTALTDPRMRADLVTAGGHLVDALGAWRVVQMWEQAKRWPLGLPPIVDAALVARPATLADARDLWEWRNDPATRAGSRSADPVPWLAHRDWLESSLTRQDRLLLILEDPVGPVGTARWDLRSDGEWEVSITVAPQRRGHSLARPMLRAAEVALSEVALSEVALSEDARSGRAGVTAYRAVVRIDNVVSLRLFESSAYVPDLPPDPKGFMRLRKNARVP